MFAKNIDNPCEEIPLSFSSIEVMNIKHHKGYNIYFIYSVLLDEYEAMYGENIYSCYGFKTEEEAKQRVDSFLDKMIKLKAFI